MALTLPGAVHARRVVACCGCAAVCCCVLICPRPHGRHEPAQPTPDPGYHSHSVSPCRGPASQCAQNACELPACRQGWAGSLPLLGMARLGQSVCCDWGYWSDEGSVRWELAGAGHMNGGPSSTLPMAGGLQPTSWCLLLGCLVAASAWPPHYQAPALLSWWSAPTMGSSPPCLPLAARTT